MHDNHHQQDMLIVKLSKGKFILHELSIQRLGEILILDMIFLCLFRYYKGRELVYIVFLYKISLFLLAWRLVSQIFAFYSSKIFFVKVHPPFLFWGTGSRQLANILTNCRYLVCFFLFGCFTNLEFPSGGGGCLLIANFWRSWFAQP